MQITFENARALWFLFVIPLLYVTHMYWLRHTKRKAMKFANFKALKRVTGKNLITKNYSLLFLRMLILLFAILAASQTVIWYEGLANEQAFVIAIDSSSSMQASDIKPTRMDAAKEYADLFIDSLSGQTSVGLVSFSGVTMVEQVLTNDKSLVKDQIDKIHVVEAGGTDIPGAIIASTNLLLAADQGKSIILITDGSNTLETFISNSVQRGVGYAQENHIVIHAIGIGGDSGPVGYLPSYYNVSPVYNEDNLKYIANQTGGTYSHADSKEELLTAYKGIAENTNESLIRLELAPNLMLVALLLIFLEWGLISTRFRTIP